MRIHLSDETALELSRLAEPGFDVEPGEAGLAFGSMHMFVSAVALCTYSVLAAYAERAGAPAEGIEIRVRWRYGERPKRIAAIDMRVKWPGLPESRLDAATRAAHQCTLHNTLRDGVEIDTLVEN